MREYRFSEEGDDKYWYIDNIGIIGHIYFNSGYVIKHYYKNYYKNLNRFGIKLRIFNKK